MRERCAEFLDQSTYNVTQSRYAETIIDELAVNGVVGTGRLFEDPYTEIIAAPLDPAGGFEFGELTVIRTILTDLRDAAVPVGA